MGHTGIAWCRKVELPVAGVLPRIPRLKAVRSVKTEMAQRVADRCMQIHGGMGLTNELGLEAVWRWARSMRIPDGTSEIQRRTVARRLLKGDRNF